MKLHISLAAFAAAAMLVAPGSANAQARERGQEQNANHQMRFQWMDPDNDGVITRDEWRGSDESFRQHDTNHDGVLSGNEVWVPAGREQRTAEDRARREDRLARFNRLDTDGDRRISLREWTGDRPSFDRIDRNHDQFVSRNEFVDYSPAERPVGTSGSQAATQAYKAGYQQGLGEGREAGREDKNVNGGKWDLEGQRELEQADSGYRNELGLRTDYQAGYRAGFRIGYREGFGPRH